jgi:hypothetical protein
MQADAPSRNPRLEPRRQSLYGNPQLDSIIWCVNYVLARAEIPLGSLDGRMAQEQLDLLKLAIGRPTQLCGPPF